MYYKVERTFLTNAAGQYGRARDPKPYLVQGDSASAAASAFITDESASLVGSITPLPGDKASATAEAGHRVFVIFIERAGEAIRPRS